MRTLVAWNHQFSTSIGSKGFGAVAGSSGGAGVLSPASPAAGGGVRQRGGESSWEGPLNPLKQKLSELTCQTSKELNFTVLSTVLSAIGRPKV